LQGALTSPKAKNYAAILEPAKFGQLLRAIEVFDGSAITKYALLLSPHIYVRPGELRHAEWEEFDLDGAIWRIPPGKMKSRRKHDVPLSMQSVAILRELRKLTGPKGYPGISCAMLAVAIPSERNDAVVSANAIPALRFAKISPSTMRPTAYAEKRFPCVTRG